MREGEAGRPSGAARKVNGRRDRRSSRLAARYQLPGSAGQLPAMMPGMDHLQPEKVR